MTSEVKTLADVELKEEGDRGQVTAVFSTFDVVDLDGDVTRKGAFTEGAPVVISAYGHTSWDGSLPIGKGTIHERDDDAVLRGSFFLNTSHGRDAWETVKELSTAGLQEWSYSLQNVSAEEGEVDGKAVRVLTKIDVKEVSPVLRGAGIDTRTLTIKSGSMKFADHIETVLTALDEVTERALEVVTYRAAQGKSFGTVTDLVDQVTSRAAELKRRVDELATPNPDDELDIASQWARFVAISEGVMS